MPKCPTTVLITPAEQSVRFGGFATFRSDAGLSGSISRLLERSTQTLCSHSRGFVVHYFSSCTLFLYCLFTLDSWESGIKHQHKVMQTVGICQK